MMFRFLLITVFFTLHFINIHAQTGHHGSEKRTDLMEKGRAALIQKKYPLAIKKFTEAEEIVSQENNPELLWKIKNYIGQAYNGIGANNKALNELIETTKILDQHKDLQRFTPVVLNNIASIYIEEKKYPEALYYLKRGISFFNGKNNNKDLRHVHYFLVINLADLYNKTDKYKSALSELETLQTRDLKIYPEASFLRDLTIAQSLLLSGSTTESKAIATKLLQNSKDKDPYQDELLELLAEINIKAKEYTNAALLLKKSIQKTTDWRKKARRYSLMSKIYADQGNLLLKSTYQDSIILSKDSLAAITNRDLISNTAILLDIEKYKNEILLNREIQKGKQQLYWSVIIGLIALITFLYFWQKNRLQKQKQEKLLIQNNEKLALLSLEEKRKDLLLTKLQLKTQKEKDKYQQEQLQAKIAEKNRMLATKALFITERNKLITDIVENLSKIKEVSNDLRIQKYLQSLKSELRLAEDWNEFVKLFEEINPNLVKLLQEKHPNLSQTDIRFLSYLYMNLSLQEIASVMVITTEASKKRKQRIAQKLEVETSDLTNYLQKLEKESRS